MTNEFPKVGMHIFEIDNYLDLLNSVLDSTRGTRGFKSRLAEGIGCQRTYLVSVLNGKAHITPEQAFNLGTFLGFDDLQKKYLMALVSKDRAGTKVLQNHYAEEMSHLREQALKKQNKLVKQKNAHEIDHIYEYYSHWAYAAIHVLVSIDGLRKIDPIAKALQLPADMVEEILLNLEKMGLISYRDDHWIQTQKNVFLSRSSPIFRNNHLNWRLKANSRIGFQDQETFFTGVYSLSKQDQKILSLEIQNLLVSINQRAGRSVEETIAVLCLDFFDIL